MARYHIWTEGCQMNVADSAKLAAGLSVLGYEETDHPDDADLVVVNTCVIRQSAEDRAISRLGEFKKIKQKRPEFKIAVMGCMVGPRTEDLTKRFPYVDVFAQPQNFDPILALVAPEDDLGGEFWPTVFPEPTGPTAYIPVIHGCDKFCTYCIVPYRRGRERSRTIDDIRGEVEFMASRGVREVTLLGQTVEAYGKDLPDRPDLGDLLEAIHDVPGLARIRFLTSYPKDMTPHIIETASRLPKVCEFINIPVQSGDNDVLQRMRRGYTIEEYREKVALIRQHMPDASITTDVIVGFCGETEQEFQNTYDLLAELRFDKVHVAAYSPRPGTIAWRRMEDDVPREVKHERLQAIEELEARIASEINSRLLNTTQEVLVEGEKGGKLYGRTRTNKLVHFTGTARPGGIVNVLIEKTSPWSLQGRVAATAATS